MDRRHPGAGAGEAPWPRRDRLHLRGHQRQAVADGVVPARLRILHLAARMGASKGRAGDATAAQMAACAATPPVRTVLRAPDAGPPSHPRGGGVVTRLVIPGRASSTT